jgi:hypothetical protein
MSTTIQLSEVIDENAAAEILGLSAATIRRWRCEPPPNLPPLPYIKYGSSKTAKVRYLRDVVVAWRDALTRRGDGASEVA